jgi:hypothetical protein
MKKYIILSSTILFVILSSILVTNSSCAVSQKVQNKTGIQLWGENCGRCHNAPGPGEFSATNWEIVGRHMRIRTNITETEEQKIVDYLKTTAN